MSTSKRLPRVPCGADGRPLARDAELTALLAGYQDTVMRSNALDPVLTECIRLRCARQHDCRICQTLRLSDAADLGMDKTMSDKIDRYETSDLGERITVALRIVDAFIWSPRSMSEELIASAHEQFSEVELAEILLDVTKWSTQKIHVALGTDSAAKITTDADGVRYFSFDAQGRPLR
jgi:alkylhydroperoxidase family enzyme